MTTPGRGFRPSGRPAGRRAVLAGALATAATVLGTAASRAAAPPDGKALVTVDFATATPATSMSGFLNSIRYPDPPTAMIAPLQPRLWRSNDLRLHGDIRSWGARFEGPLSDGWSHPVGGNWAPPYEDFPKWEGFVRTIARETRGREIWWDIWNEPDSPGSWLGPRDLFFETWIRAARVLREELGPGTLVGGPSTTSFQPEFIEALLAKCLASQTQINFLAWHELEPWSDISLVAENIRLARRKFLNDPRWAALGLREIHIHEFLGEVDQYRPGELVAFLWFLESGGADAASRSCWSGACTDNSIDGIIDSVTRQPRADWWVHRFYAEGVNARVRWHAGERHVVAIAQALPANGRNVQVLIGYYGHEGATRPYLDLRLRLDGVSRVLRGDAARVRIIHLPDSGPAPLPRPPVLSDGMESIADDSMVFDLGRLSVHDAIAITLGEP